LAYGAIRRNICFLLLSYLLLLYLPSGLIWEVIDDLATLVHVNIAHDHLIVAVLVRALVNPV